jgi:hypothetical protein
VLQTEELPACIANLNTGLTAVDRNDFSHDFSFDDSKTSKRTKTNQTI